MCYRAEKYQWLAKTPHTSRPSHTGGGTARAKEAAPRGVVRGLCVVCGAMCDGGDLAAWLGAAQANR
jgi:hypothetical protein